MLSMAVSLLLAGSPDASVAEPLVFGDYELGALARPCVPVAPVRLAPALGFEQDVEAEKPAATVDEYANVLRQLSGEELLKEGRSITLDGTRLSVTAPRAVQDLAARTFGFLEDSLDASTELALDVVTLPAGRELGAAVVPLADAAKLVDSSESRRGSWRISVRSGCPAGVDATRYVPLVPTFDVEVAQGMAIFDPIVLPVALGQRTVVQAAPAEHGTWLALVQRSVDSVGDVRDVDLPMSSLIGNALAENVGADGQPTQRPSDVARPPRLTPGPRKVQSITVQDRSIALSTFLPEGRALVVTTSIENGDAKGVRALVVRQVGRPLPLAARLRSEKSDHAPDALALDLASTQPPRVVLEGGFSRSTARSRSIGFPLEGDPTFVAMLATTQYEDAAGQVYAACMQSSADPQPDSRVLGAWAVVTGSAGMGVAPGSDADPSTRIARIRPAPRLFQVSLALSRRGAAIARATVPVRAGAHSALVLGTESIAIEDANVEVAQAAAIPAPLANVEMEGLCATLRPLVGASGALTLEVGLWARSRGGTRAFVAGDSFTPPLAQSTFDQLVLDESVRFERGENPRKASFGDRSGSGDGLLLEVEIAEVP